MPIYEYRCKECAHEVEELQKLSDPPLVTCPACGKPTLQKLVSAAGFQLKGSGWYVTDFRGGAGGAKKAEKEAGKADAPAADSAKSETKSETKSESTTKSEPAAPAASTTSTTPSSSSES
ncbi:MAG: zinc ribbon domain-containing protein [Casimicrobiaceae bacterium]|jgi:putative FmdB family regulatory protein